MDEGGWLPVIHSNVIRSWNILVKRSCLRANCLLGTVVMSFRSYFCPLIMHLSVHIYAPSLQACKLALVVLVCAWFCLQALRYGSNSDSLYEDVGCGWKTPEGYKCFENNFTIPIDTCKEIWLLCELCSIIFHRQIKVLILERSKSRWVPPVKSFRFITRLSEQTSFNSSSLSFLCLSRLWNLLKVEILADKWIRTGRCLSTTLLLLTY